MGDDVNAQHRLVTEAFGLDHLALVFGGSMGAVQALEWACRYPGFAQRVAALAGVGTTRPHAVVIGKIVQDILTSAPGFNGGARLTVIEGKADHLGLFAIEPDYMPQINAALSGLLGEQV